MSKPATGPDAFADSIAARYHSEIAGDGGSLGLEDAIIAREHARGAALDANTMREIRENNGLAGLVERFYADLLGLCPAPLQDFCAEHVRLRCVRSIAIEGAVAASDEGDFVVIVTTALMTYLNKVKKFILAENDLSRVTHCNRMPVERLTLRIVRGMLDEVISNFRQGEARGPMLLLDEQGTMTVQMMLDFQEAFVVAHEIGHLLADHLLRSAIARALNESFGSLAHRSEYVADMIGFCLLRRRALTGIPSPGNEADYVAQEILRISSICEFFEILELAYPHATASHPASVDRAANLLATFYGEPFGAHYNSVRAGEAPRFDWEPLFGAGLQPSMLERVIFDLVTSPDSISKLVDLVDAQGLDALAALVRPQS